MASSQHGQPGRQNREISGQSRQSSRFGDSMAHSVDAATRLRNEESWVEISSQPSSSSLSSIGDEIVTTGLRIQHDTTIRRRRRTQTGVPLRADLLPRQASTSSQEEYDESESEDEDHAMTSSNEHIPSPRRALPRIRSLRDVLFESEDDDENSTALGRLADEPAFTPQPNAFSHPPSSQSSQHPVSGSYFPRTSLPSLQQRSASYPNRSTQRPQHTPYNTVSPAYQADNDAALRASLTTLLSCAAAARGLPKRNQPNTVNRPEFTGLRLVPESELPGAATSPIISRPLSPSTHARSSPSISSQDVDQGKRKATSNKPAQSRATKKKRMAAVEEAMVSPTLLTWVVSAGVVVLVSVVGFGAGYVMGREVGRQELLNAATEGASCGKEAAMNLGEIRRFRWGNGSKVIVA